MLLTAGHCNVGFDWQGVWVWEPGGGAVNFGGQIPYYYYGGGDAGLLENISSRGTLGGYMNWSTNGYSQLTGYYSSGSAPVGSVVCKHSGRTIGNGPGDACAAISNVNLSVAYGGITLHGMIRAHSGICSKGGDSGSPIALAASETAVGVMSGGENTAAWDPCGGGFIEPISRALSAWNLSIYGLSGWQQCPRRTQRGSPCRSRKRAQRYRQLKRCGSRSAEAPWWSRRSRA